MKKGDEIVFSSDGILRLNKAKQLRYFKGPMSPACAIFFGEVIKDPVLRAIWFNKISLAREVHWLDYVSEKKPRTS